jgi:hypothetical protein
MQFPNRYTSFVVKNFIYKFNRIIERIHYYTASAFSWILKLTADKLFRQLNCMFAVFLLFLDKIFLMFNTQLLNA